MIGVFRVACPKHQFVPSTWVTILSLVLRKISLVTPIYSHLSGNA
jgi:hypothetical protein